MSFASFLGKASRARAAGAKPLQPERASSALSAKRLVFSNISDYAFKVSWFSFRLRLFEMRRDTSDTLGFSFFAFSQNREAVTESIGRDARVREN